MKSLALILISPINFAILCLCIGFYALKFKGIIAKSGKSVIFVGVLWFLLCSQYSFSYWLINSLENRFPPVKAENETWQKQDAIWVLACYHFDAQELPLMSQFSQCSIERLLHAVNMYKVKPLPIVLTGGKFVENSSLSHAAKASELLASFGVAKSHIHIIPEGTNTLEESQALLSQSEFKSFAVVSSATHGLRVTKILTANATNFIFVPVHYGGKTKATPTINLPSTDAIKLSERAIYEYLALLNNWATE